MLNTEASASDRLLERVRKLLAKAEDESVTPPEAQALTAKAAELMAKYGIDRALLAAECSAARTLEITAVAKPSSQLRRQARGLLLHAGTWAPARPCHIWMSTDV